MMLMSLLFLVATPSFATLITTPITEDLAADTYITYQGYDWTWAAPINTTNYSDNDPTTGVWVDNVFEDASFHTGWMYIDTPELNALFSTLTLADFTNSNNEIIQSVAYWNSHFVHVDTGDFNQRSGVKSADVGAENNETFYVRVAVAQVPEPTTLFIFAASLLGFSIRKRYKNNQ